MIWDPFPSIDVCARFWRKFDIGDASSCWVWKGTRKPNGYGAFMWRDGGVAVTRYAHRLAFEHFKGTIPPGLHIDHVCRNRACVNPAHLEAVTQAENNLRAYEGMCARGLHEMTGKNLRIASDGSRRCRACFNDWRRTNRRQRAAAAYLRRAQEAA